MFFQTLVIIILDSHFQLLRDLTTARNSFFVALYPTAAILIALPTCLPQIRENLIAFIILRMWRQHGLFKLIVVCHRRYSLTWRKQSQEKSSVPTHSAQHENPGAHRPEQKIEDIQSNSRHQAEKVKDSLERFNVNNFQLHNFCYFIVSEVRSSCYLLNVIWM